MHTILQQAGEAERYEQCRAALENLARLRQAIWDGLQQDQQNQELARQHAQWCSSGISEGQYEQLSRYIEELDESAASVRSAMASLVELVWIEEYLNVRIEPLRAAVAGMRMKQIPMHD